MSKQVRKQVSPHTWVWVDEKDKAMSKLYTEEQVRKAIRDTRYFTNADSENVIINNMTPIELPTDEERDKRFMDFLQKEHELGLSDKPTIERIEWYYDTYFAISKIKGGQDE